MEGRRIDAHDRNQVELKLDYLIDPDRDRQDYRADLFMFLPTSLGVRSDTYSAEQFFSETAHFMRLKTPVVALASLADAAQAAVLHAPLVAKLNAVLAGRNEPLDELENLIRVTGCIYRSAIRDELAEILRRINHLRSMGVVERKAGREELAQVLQGFSQDVKQAVEHLQALGHRCERGATPSAVRDLWWAVDEFVTLLAEDALTRLIQTVDGFPCDASVDEDPLVPVREAVAQAAVAAYHHRRGRGYSSYARPLAGPDEGFPFRRRILKRLVSSVLYLNITERDAGRTINDIVGMVAAATAMLFAMLVAVWAQKKWGGFEAAFVGVMVVSYIIKDRIKEWGRRYLGARLKRFVPTRILTVRDAKGVPIGECRENFELMVPSQIDREILDLRHIDHPTEVAGTARPELTLYYSKDVRLSARALSQQLPGVQGLNDIVRLNFSRLCSRMDDPDEVYTYVQPETHKLVNHPCSRVYHLNLVLRTVQGRGAKQRKTLDRIRIVIDQRGIRRLEHVGQSVQAGLDPLTGLGPGDLMEG